MDYNTFLNRHPWMAWAQDCWFMCTQVKFGAWVTPHLLWYRSGPLMQQDRWPSFPLLSECVVYISLYHFPWVSFPHYNIDNTILVYGKIKIQKYVIPLIVQIWVLDNNSRLCDGLWWGGGGCRLNCVLFSASVVQRILMKTLTPLENNLGSLHCIRIEFILDYKF